MSFDRLIQHGSHYTSRYYMHSLRSRALSFRVLNTHQGFACLRRQRTPQDATRFFTRSATLPLANTQPTPGQLDAQDESKEMPGEAEQGAMSRRLGDMTERTVEETGRRAKKYVEEAGFSEELKKRLEARIAEGNFKSETPQAFAQVGMPVCGISLLTKAAIFNQWAGKRRQGNPRYRSRPAMDRIREARRRCTTYAQRCT